MKLIIDISKDRYNEIMAMDWKNGTRIYDEDIRAIHEGKPIEQEPKTGHWVDIDEEPHEVWECDHCGFVIDGSGCIEPYDYRDTYKFCPNCGCRMSEIPTGSESEG